MPLHKVTVSKNLQTGSAQLYLDSFPLRGVASYSIGQSGSAKHPKLCLEIDIEPEITLSAVTSTAQEKRGAKEGES